MDKLLALVVLDISEAHPVVDQNVLSILSVQVIRPVLTANALTHALVRVATMPTAEYTTTPHNVTAMLVTLEILIMDVQ